jgi:cell division protein FtsB
MEMNLEAALGTLAAYFAIMAVLAVGTEVVLDILKLKMLKKPTSPSKALADLKEWVPKEKWDDLEERVKFMEDTIRELDQGLSQIQAGISEIRRRAEPVLKEGEVLTYQTVATVVRRLEARYDLITANRVAWIRLLSLIVGIGWAVMLQINSLDLLGPVIPDVIKDLLGGVQSTWYGIAGLVLSGLGAAAGSSFWHDQMARLQQAQQVVDTAEQLKAQATAIASGVVAARTSAQD